VLYYLSQWLAEWAGPVRLFSSNIFLAGAGTAMAAGLVWWLLPKLWHLLPRDQGRAHAVGAEHSIGKPMSAGILFILPSQSRGHFSLRAGGDDGGLL
jgi:phospho-N-acetylmuramoyl-pentapeptide-transferase